VVFDPKDFEFDNDPSSDAEIRITYRGSESQFTVGGDARQYVGSRVAGDGPPWPYQVYSWSGVEDRLSAWLGEVKQDIETPDLLAELEREREVLGTGPAETVENAAFNPDERQEIAKQLQEIKEFAENAHSLSGHQMKALEAKIEYLNDAADRLGRLDWRAAALGTMFTLAAEAMLPPEAARHIFLMLFQPLGHLFGHPLLELPPGS